MTSRIFVIEDNELIRQSLIEFLCDLLPARIVGWADTEEEAVLWLHNHRGEWDLAIVDLFLLHGNGLGVLEHCQDARRPGQKMVVLSNYPTPQIRERCLAAGADAVFDKSRELEEFSQYTLEEVASG